MKKACARWAPEVGKEIRPRGASERAVEGDRSGVPDEDTKAEKSTKTQRPQRTRRTEFKFTVLRRPCGLLTLADLCGLSSATVLCSPLCPCLFASLEREPEHDLRDPHEPRLVRDLPERRATRRRADGIGLHAVEQVDHLDLDLRRL